LKFFLQHEKNKKKEKYPDYHDQQDIFDPTFAYQSAGQSARQV